MTSDFTVYDRLAKLEKAVHTLQQELKEALKEIKELKQRVCDDDCR